MTEGAERQPALRDAIAAVEESIARREAASKRVNQDTGGKIIGAFADAIEDLELALATLQQHERLTANLAAANERIARLEGARRATMEVLHWAREYMDALCNGEEAAVQGGLLTQMSKAVDALDALPTPDTAGPQE